MGYPTLRSFAVVTALALSAVAQAPPKVIKPGLPGIAGSPVNSSVVDVPAVEPPKIVAAPNTATAPPPPPSQSAPKAVRLAPVAPTIDIPDELKSKVAMAAQQVKAGQLPEAIALYTEILTSKPDLFTLSIERGKLYQQRRDHQKAIADFTAAIAARGDYAEAYFRRCVSEYESMKHKEAVVDCSKAIELNPNPFDYYYYRGLAYTATRTWDKAATDLAAANDRNGEYPDSHLQLGRVYFEMEQLLPSLREFTLAIQQKPGFSEAYKGRAAVKAALGDAVGSKDDLARLNR